MKKSNTKVLSRIENEIRPLKLVTGALLILQSFLVFLFNFDTVVSLQGPLLELPIQLPGDMLMISVRIEFLIAFYLFVAGLRTLLQATAYYEKYRQHIIREVSVLRWVEYAVTAPLMVIIVAMLLGVGQLTLLGTLFLAMAIVIYLGYRAEVDLSNHKKEAAYIQFILGLVVQAVVFGVLLHSVFTSSGAAVSEVSGLILFSSLLIFFLTFPVIMILWVKKYKIWKDYITVEFSYIVASYFAKTGLAALITVTLLLH